MGGTVDMDRQMNCSVARLHSLTGACSRQHMLHVLPPHAVGGGRRKRRFSFFFLRRLKTTVLHFRNEALKLHSRMNLFKATSWAETCDCTQRNVFWNKLTFHSSIIYISIVCQLCVLQLLQSFLNNISSTRLFIASTQGNLCGLCTCEETHNFMEEVQEFLSFERVNFYRGHRHRLDLTLRNHTQEMILKHLYKTNKNTALYPMRFYCCVTFVHRYLIVV